MELTIYAGLHIGGPFEMNMPEIFQSNSMNTLLLGDIIDMANCEKNYECYSKLVELSDLHGPNYIFGDDERVTPEDIHYVGSNFVAVHGGFQMSPAESRDYRLRPWGSEWRWFKCLFKKKKTRDLDVIFFERAVEIANYYKVKNFICGYFYPRKLIDVEYKGITIFMVPRGKTKITIKDV